VTIPPWSVEMVNFSLSPDLTKYVQVLRSPWKSSVKKDGDSVGVGVSLGAYVGNGGRVAC
jgi:hypothetical protein